MMKNKIIITLLLLVTGIYCISQNIPERPSPPRLVNDFAGILNTNEIDSLEQILLNFSNETSNQITVVTVKSLDGYDKAEYAYKIGESWGVGTKDFNNGIVFLIKPKYDNEKGETFIAPGYGLEGAVPDATCKMIAENEAIPEFSNNNYYIGIKKAVTTLISITKGEYSAKQYEERNKKSGWTKTIVIFVIIIIVLALISASKKRGGGSNMGGGGYVGGGWSSSGGGWSNFSSGGGSFGGFGGGSFGGGGAGGSW